jgi:hypothetical protein
MGPDYLVTAVIPYQGMASYFAYTVLLSCVWWLLFGAIS